MQWWRQSVGKDEKEQMVEFRPLGKVSLAATELLTDDVDADVASLQGRLRYRPSGCKALILRTCCMPPLGTILKTLSISRSVGEEARSGAAIQFLTSVRPKTLALVRIAVAFVGDDLAAVWPRHQGA